MSVYAFSDIHGNYNLFKQIKDFLKSDDRCYVLGDCADRGKDGYLIIKKVLEDSRFIYIKGNHEDMFANSILLPADCEYRADYIRCWMQNGGENTVRAFRKDNSPMDIVIQLNNLPEVMDYTNADGITYIMSHAGFSPQTPEEHRDYLWDRTHFEYDDNTISPNIVILHGHTPIRYMANKEINNGVYIYNKGRKINLDCGTAATNRVVLYNLDNYSVKDFYSDN